MLEVSLNFTVRHSAVKQQTLYTYISQNTFNPYVKVYKRFGSSSKCSESGQMFIQET